MNSIIKRPNSELLGNSFELLPNAFFKYLSIIVHDKPTEEDYEEAFRRLFLIETAQSWWWGDLANAREKQYSSLEGLAERLDLNYGNLRKCASICSQYELLLHSNLLGFKHR